MAGCSEFRPWAYLLPELLGLIFCKLSLQEILTVVPAVCKTWNDIVLGPYCWVDIDILEWSIMCKPEQLDRMVQMLLTRSSGACSRLTVSGLHTESIFNFIADNSESLKKLELPRSEITDAIVEQLVPRFSNLTSLDLSECHKITARALEAFGTNCKSLVELRRRMHPVDMGEIVFQDDQLYAIANTMPKLRRLQINYLPLTANSVLEILSRCKDLEYLDLRGCWDVKLNKKWIKEKYPNLKVVGPDILDFLDNSWEDCSDDSDSSGYSWMDEEDGVSDDEQVLDDFQIHFFGPDLDVFASLTIGFP
ncbi:F-box protein FBW2-like [Canna indica]|uniref:F-box protein FBW2-like n=1 Tax=Canna indica TaxID=4628 RepID=A0AAQ3L722_9LILI|nr:F-box protein FBW2-like [Canna indica]